ncbi:hypothetical protein ATO6_05355 [Oceanicola sp. 22II-s10i]|uniref:c-type cytochrome n=1 Tax=Oceanicola sp. 22II-s10i TaxID=1317116 RepID=UPI000B528BD2|nr:cytochrome c [Oceanicola sp. 22II-s10i]OWU86263.1 hypothetical protein ATO6_05355 [Oceanicola sp. 22II-s10i]
MTRNGPTLVLILTIAAFTTGALAQVEPTDPTVKARMELMKDIRAQMGTLGGMAQGKMAFDADAAAEARRALAEDASEIPAAFEQRATDPATEAAPAIWEDFADFTAKAKLLEDAATKLGTGSLDDLKAGIGEIGQACSGCHKLYRIEN